MAGRMELSLRDLAADHDTAIDLIDLSMQAIRANRPGCPAPEDLAEWTRLTRAIQERNSPVVLFLIRIVADMGVQSWPEPDVLLRTLRGMATDRLEASREMLIELGWRS